MTEPMSDKRLAYLDEWAVAGNWTNTEIAREILNEAKRARAEIDRLRAELAARPEPIGYVVARLNLETNTTTSVWDEVRDTPVAVRDLVARFYHKDAVFLPCALVPIPVEATP